MKTLKWIDSKLARLEGGLIVIFLGLMVVFTFLQVLLRGLYTHMHLHWANTLMGNLDWSEPLVRLLVLWLTFLGASLVTGENKHIKIDILSPLLPSGWLRLREFILSLVCLLISCLMVKVSIQYIGIEIEFGGRMFLHLPNWTGQLILPLGFALISVRFSLRAIDQLFHIAREIRK